MYVCSGRDGTTMWNVVTKGNEAILYVNVDRNILFGCIYMGALISSNAFCSGRDQM